MPILATAQEIITAAGQELGLEVGTIGVLQTGDNGVQALALLNSLGDDLVRVYDWQFLQFTNTFSGDGVTSAFPMPANFARVVNQTEWAKNMKRPMQGPLTAQQWGWTQFGIVSVGVFYKYRILQNKFNVFPTPGVGEDFAFFYMSKNWVESGTTPGTYKDKCSSVNDIPQFDRRLMINGLKLRLWAQKGFDTSALAREFDFVLANEKGQSTGAQQISLSGPIDTFYLNPLTNIPDGNW